MSVSKTYELEDCFKYIANGSKTFNITEYDIENIVDIQKLTGDYEISIKLSSNTKKGFGISLNTTNSNENNDLIRAGYDAFDERAIVSKNNSNVSENYVNKNSYNPNTEILIKMTNVGRITCSIDNFNQVIKYLPPNLRYVQLESWNTAKTITYKDFKVKRL